ncbi:MAG: shikimate dehydrogenase [Chitinophagales bacterium]|nr:shikimate dehydrogenase [Chitinophagales bacterium]
MINLAAVKNLYGLIGFPLSHSFSKGYFAEKFIKEEIIDSYYDTFPLENIAQFPSLIQQHANLKGLNVTIPYKQQIIPFLDTVDEAATTIGAVNTIKFSNGILSGHNSDAFGFEQSLLPLINQTINQAIILGTGGASKAVAYVLNQLNIPFIYLSRNANHQQSIFSYDEFNQNNNLADYLLVVNTTPLGMYPNEQSCPSLNYNQVSKNHIFYDLVYNPTETVFLANAKSKGATTKNGLEMLYLQAEKSWQIWNA